MKNNQTTYSSVPVDRLPWRSAGHPLALSLILGAVLSACSANFQMFSPATELPKLSPLLEASALQPRETGKVEIGNVSGEPIFLAIEEATGSSSDRLIVLIHGVLSDRSSWRFLAADLGQDHSLLMVDLLGCGASSQPDPARLGAEGYGPTAQAGYVLEVLRKRLGPDDHRPIALVGHSLGGAVILRMLGDNQLRTEYSEVVARVDRVVLFSPLDFAVEKPHPALAKIANLGRTKVGLGVVFRALRRQVARSALASAVDSTVVPREEPVRTYQILRHKRSRRPVQAMIQQGIPFSPKTRRPDWERIERLVADYSYVSPSTLILWGARDETLPVSMGYKLRAQLPNARLRVVEQSMHSLASERPQLSADFIRRFLPSGGEDWEEISYVSVAELRQVPLS